MADGYIPSQDGQFTTWSQNLLNVIKADPATYGVDAAAVAALQDNVTKWESSYGESIQQRDAAKAAVVEKDVDRKKLEEIIRSMARQIQADPEVTGKSKAMAGLPVRKTVRTKTPVPTLSLIHI